MSNDRRAEVLGTAHALLEHLQLLLGGRICIPAQNARNTTSTHRAEMNTPEVPQVPLSKENRRRLQLDVSTLVPMASIFEQPGDFLAAQSLDELYQRIHTCTKCPLGTMRTNFVFGTGNPSADIVFIGEAPGADEDLKGEPFVGRAGQLLTKILAAIKLERSDVYICNILKCRPPNNRTPLPSEIEQCKPYLYKQLSLIEPTFVVALGLTAAETLLGRKLKMSHVRGKWFDFYGARLMVTYHPAALLRNPELKRDSWEDVQKLRRAYDEFLRSGVLPEPIGHVE